LHRGDNLWWNRGTKQRDSRVRCPTGRESHCKRRETAEQKAPEQNRKNRRLEVKQGERCLHFEKRQKGVEIERDSETARQRESSESRFEGWVSTERERERREKRGLSVETRERSKVETRERRQKTRVGQTAALCERTANGGRGHCLRVRQTPAIRLKEKRAGEKLSVWRREHKVVKDED
jgi:hypothetical protein